MLCSVSHFNTDKCAHQHHQWFVHVLGYIIKFILLDIFQQRASDVRDFPFCDRWILSHDFVMGECKFSQTSVLGLCLFFKKMRYGE